jgi:hypothetical protein
MVAMTDAERQRRRYAKQKQVAEPPHDPDRQPASPAPTGDELLRRERDNALQQRAEALKELNQLRRERDDANERADAVLRGAVPQPVIVENRRRLCWCSFCRKRWGDDPGLPRSQVEMIFDGKVGPAGPFVCNECVEKFSTIIAEKRRSAR